MEGLAAVGTTLLLLAAILFSMFAYSVSWEAVRLVRDAEPDRPRAVRGALKLAAFVAVGPIWPVLTLASLIRYRTAWPVSAGQLRLRPLTEPWWRWLIRLLIGISLVWIVIAVATPGRGLMDRGPWQWGLAAVAICVSFFTVVVVGLHTDELPAGHSPAPAVPLDS
jgi:hypothetical protein